MPSIKRGPDDDDDGSQHHAHQQYNASLAQELAAAAAMATAPAAPPAAAPPSGHATHGLPTSTVSTNDGPPPRKRNTGSTRTGQACDRCKIRKIRCDATPGGCTPCRQNGSECRTTDRITGRQMARGQVEQLEHEVTGLKMWVAELQSQIRAQGQDPVASPAGVSGDVYGVMPLSQPSERQTVVGKSAYTTQAGGLESKTMRDEGRENATQGSLLPEFRQGCIGDNYLGVASSNNWLSPIEGTSLALFGTKIDLTEFLPPSPNAEADGLSYESFLKHAFNKSSPPPPKPELPSFEEYKMYADVYFVGIQPFIPILHKPDFMSMVRKMYSQTHEPNAAEETMIHMVLAIMFFQWSARNPSGSEQFRGSSFQHYHYALSIVPQLMSNHQIQDIQALALICSYLRSQPRPGAAWMFTNLVMGLAVESGLHRSNKAWPSTAAEKDMHLVEMRKRIFWSILLLHVAISGKLGRPMPLRSEDFDIEIPEEVDDTIPGESTSLPKWKRCSFRAGIQGFKLLKILMNVYSTIYSVRSAGEPYEVRVRQLEKDLETFQNNVPPELAGGPQTREEDRVPALYLQLSKIECDLLLHHPSLNRSGNSQTAVSHLELCLDASNKMLTVALQLKRLKSLDTTWFYTTDFLAAIFTTLFAFYEKRESLTQEDVGKLRGDMEKWLEVMGEVGELLGTGPKLEAAIRNIVDYSLTHINRRLAEQTASAASAAIASEAQQPGLNAQQQPQPHQHQPQSFGGQEYYATSTHYPYQATESNPNQYQQNPATAMQHYDGSSYNAEGMQHNIEAQLNAELNNANAHSSQHQTPSNFAMAFQPPPQLPSHAAFTSQPPFPSGSAAWRHFADNMMVPTLQHAAADLHQFPAATANMGALQSTGSDGSGSGLSAPMAAAATFGEMQMPTDPTQTWPGIAIQYGMGTGHGGGD
ncbi:hypothetical protein KC360_g4276 [Hortaea werneckii]|nr:hypothetical protein KC325_g4351 [Hortaea werneckii]KAI6993768.1 hypothetical protein KC359_g4980 [Hortaea werneckii]KAI7145751.1 hypothetical protein KC344_g4257 [Hortaea werneckii]KAI7174435.1 hypothetical protein KC360_g4276 [Hortaea werneckii]